MMSESDRLRPQVHEPARGPEQLRRLQLCLARAELTDGLTLAQLIGETQSRIPRDASVIVILPRVDEEKAIALANLRRSGYAVTAILNMYDEYDFAEASGPLLAAGIGTQQLRDEASVVSVCRKFVLR